MQISRTSLYNKWFRKLRDIQAKATINARLRRIELHGELLGDFKYIDDSVIELRFNVGPGYRVYLTQRNDQLLLLLIGGDKSSQKADIDKAKQLANEWRNKK